MKPNTSENSPYQVEKKLGKPVTRAGIKDPTFLIKDLIPGTYYLVEVSAVNRKGAGFPAKKVIRTQIGKYPLYLCKGFNNLNKSELIRSCERS